MRDRHQALKIANEFVAAMPRISVITYEVSNVPRPIFDSYTRSEEVVPIGGDLMATIALGGGVFLEPRTPADSPKTRHLKPVA